MLQCQHLKYALVILSNIDNFYSIADRTFSNIENNKTHVNDFSTPALTCATVTDPRATTSSMFYLNEINCGGSRRRAMIKCLIFYAIHIGIIVRYGIPECTKCPPTRACLKHGRCCSHHPVLDQPQNLNS
ncbi:hypothetical protein HETIRDRAFT_322166 [Heterobasidion irregulare TC 32-1]|uniref:Uncharacterized protein n=1 Tax=Heterobasidion irregulare (strain TC 32-1) TaxID=747525 RepID=W4K2G5_HETIT|nr:uncharacterized protein HETIRDRAFT_322166 [Heterobasidion irregulare TC 32-1]ETW79540.1 hypothetical protein HETIRDRAFT_322166 [Heterobasidion irregulare TC 32-1]